MKLSKYSIGIGDRFAKQGTAQLEAVVKAEKQGVLVTPVWNKSFREHQIIHSDPASTRNEADQAVKALNWKNDYFVDADHVGMNNVDMFIQSSDFFTIDVADFIGKRAASENVEKFLDFCQKYTGELMIPNINNPFEISGKRIEQIAETYLYAVEQAEKIYRHILEKKGNTDFVVEVSMDETEKPQTPVDMFFILAAIAYHNIPTQTIAPKFTGRFNKGVDYEGDLEKFAQEFEQDIAVIEFAINEFSLPENLKLSVHSGSDKFSLYGVMGKLIRKYDTGLHIKTAGTTWLEELIGLAVAGGDGLDMAKEIYRRAYQRYDELCAPYATVIDVHKEELPKPDQVSDWDSDTFVSTLRHDQKNERYDPQFRQMLHVAYKVAAEIKDRYLEMLEKHKGAIAENVTENIYERHLKPIFID